MAGRRQPGGENTPDHCPGCQNELLFTPNAASPCPTCGWYPAEGDVRKFMIEIEPGDSAIQNRGDVAEILRALADHLVDELPDRWEGENPVIDPTGRTVGYWTFHRKD